MTRLVALALALFSSASFAQPVAQVSFDKAQYQVGESATVRYRLVAQPESPAYEFFLSPTISNAPVAVKKITDTEFYSRLENLALGNKTIRLSVYLQDRALAKAINEAVAMHDAEIKRISDAILEADPADVPALEAERAMHQARRTDALAKLSSIRRLFDGPRNFTFQVVN